MKTIKTWRKGQVVVEAKVSDLGFCPGKWSVILTVGTPGRLVNDLMIGYGDAKRGDKAEQAAIAVALAFLASLDASVEEVS